MDFIERFITYVEKYTLFRPKAKIFIAVSGGVDSVTLLDVFSKIQPDYQLELKVLHLNHGIRGKEADRDQIFVENLAKQYNYRILMDKVNAPQYSKMKKLSLEESARILRYQFFSRELTRNRYDYVALGHNANDQAETILDHFLRGSGLRGLSGMKMKRDQFIRPLLEFTRGEIETYAQSMGLNYVIDTTNEELLYRRNKIRHQLIPYLKKEFNPAIISILVNTGTILRETDQFLKQESEKAFHSCLKAHKKNKIILDIDQFLNYFNVIQVYVLYYILRLLSIPEITFNFVRIEAFLNFSKRRKIGAKFLIENGWEILNDQDGLVFKKSLTSNFEYKVEINKCYNIFNGEKIFSAGLIPKEQLPKNFPGNKNIEYIDFHKVKQPLLIRNFRPGDKFIPLGMKGHKKVSDFFTDSKVPLHLRSEIPILTGEAEIIWIIGYQIDDRFKITEKTTQIVKLEINEAQHD